MVNKALGNRNDSCPILKPYRKTTEELHHKENGKMHADPLEKSNILNRQYESTFTREDEANIPQPEGQPYPPMPDIDISREEVLKLLKKINPNKASGPDMIPARILKDLAEELAPILTEIFRSTLADGEVPVDWRSSSKLQGQETRCRSPTVSKARTWKLSTLPNT